MEVQNWCVGTRQIKVLTLQSISLKLYVKVRDIVQAAEYIIGWIVSSVLCLSRYQLTFK